MLCLTALCLPSEPAFLNSRLQYKHVVLGDTEVPLTAGGLAGGLPVPSGAVTCVCIYGCLFVCMCCVRVCSVCVLYLAV